MGTTATVQSGTPLRWKTDQCTSTVARLLYPNTVAPTPIANPTTSALASRKRCQRCVKPVTRPKVTRFASR